MKDLPFSLYYDKTAVGSFSDLVSSYKPDEFASPSRSTVPLLAMVRHAPEKLAELLTRFGFSQAPSLHFEYTVQSPRGRGRPSHTDVMARAGELQLALEFKWTEPPYETVKSWLGEDTEPPNKTQRLTGWLELLQRQAESQLRVEDFSDAVYQMVHRAASACEGQGQARLAYVVFKRDGSREDVCAQYASDLRHLRSRLGGCPKFPFHLAAVTIKPTPQFQRIEPMRKGAKETKAAVAEALRQGNLFEFGAVEHVEV